MAGTVAYSSTAGSNTTVGGVSIAEGWAPSSVNNALRALMADLATDNLGGAKVAELTVASATTCDILGALSNLIAISGTTTITSLGTGINRQKFVRFTGALTLTHNGTSLILPGAANITTAAGDCMIIESDASSNVRVLAYQRADGTAIAGTPATILTTRGDLIRRGAAAPERVALGTTRQVVTSDGTDAVWGERIVLATPVASTSGTSIDFTGIPANVRRVTLMFNGVSTNGTSNPLVQIGDSGGVETSGYTGVGNGASYTTGFGLQGASATNAMSGSMVLTLLDATNNIWTAMALAGVPSVPTYFASGGAKSLSPGPLDRVRITTVGGTDTFDAGSINIMYE